MDENFVAVISNLDFKIYFHDERHIEGKLWYDDDMKEWSCDSEIDYWDFDIEINGYRLNNLVINRAQNEYRKHLEDVLAEYMLSREVESLKKYSKSDCFVILTHELSSLESFHKDFKEDENSFREQEYIEELHEQHSFPLVIHPNTRINCSEPEKYNPGDDFIRACISDFLKHQIMTSGQAIRFLKHKLEWFSHTSENTFIMSKINDLTTNTPQLAWNRNDTDLLELVTALIEMKAINNKTNTLTRKAAIEIFSKIFGIEIKDAESKLSRATERKKDISPFLTALKESFDNYVHKKK